MGQDSFIKGFLASLQDPAIQKALKEIVGEQMREELRQEVRQELSQLRNELRQELSELRSENTRLRNLVGDLEDQVESQEQYSRRNCLRISGLTEQDGEDVGETTLKLFNQKMDVQPPIQPSDIDRIHRLGEKRDDGRPRGVIVKFSAYTARNRVMKARRNLNNRNIQPKDAIYVNESLTLQRSKLLYKARMMKRQRRIEKVWTHDGSLVIKDLHGRIRSAKTCKEIEKMFSSLPLSIADANASPSN